MAATMELQEDDVQEVFFAEGLTDGLPVVPPTPARVEAMLAAGGVEAGEVIGVVPARNRTLTAEHAAVNAVMAGCAPGYFPVVLAALSAVLDPVFNPNAVLTSTGGAALCVVVSGPMAAEIGLNAGHGALGSGHRANATIGRALRLVAINVFDAKPGRMDGSSLGNPGKYSLCFAESPPPEPWEPLRVELGYGTDDTTVTVMATEGPRQVANLLNGHGHDLLRTYAAAMRNPSTFTVGKGGQGVIVLGPEHAAAVVEAGITRAEARRYLCEASRVAPDELLQAGVLLEQGSQHDMTPGPDGKLPTVREPDDIVLVTAGGGGAGWSAYLPAFAPTIHTRAVTRRVRPPGEALPDCGPDSCSVDLSR